MLSLMAVAVVGMGVEDDGEAARRSRSRSSRRGRRRSRAGIPAGLHDRGTTDGACPCNGGKVCVGPRGGRYCISGGGNKR